MRYHTYSPELRERICTLLDTSSHTRAEVAEIFQIPYTTVCNIYNDYCHNNNTVQLPKPKGRKRKLLEEEDINCIRAIFDEDCTRTLKEIKDLLFEKRQKLVCQETIRNALDNFGYSVNRVETIPLAAVTPELQVKRQEYCQWFLMSNYQNGKIIFLDETGFRVSMRRTRVSSRRGTAARVIVPAKKTRNISAIAAISYNSFLHCKVLEGLGNTNNFLVFLNELFERLPEPGYTLIMDSVKFHYSPEVQEAVQNAGHTIKCLPPSSPFFNPIEFLFSQWKNFVVAVNPRTEEELLGAIATVNQRINANHINQYFSHVNRNSWDCVQGATSFN